MSIDGPSSAIDRSFAHPSNPDFHVYHISMASIHRIHSGLQCTTRFPIFPRRIVIYEVIPRFLFLKSRRHAFDLVYIAFFFAFFFFLSIVSFCSRESEDGLLTYVSLRIQNFSRAACFLSLYFTSPRQSLSGFCITITIFRQCEECIEQEQRVDVGSRLECWHRAELLQFESSMSR
ncbi:hypothetical protein M413DRAFT_123192 [Hebeloma cylindrosporum]|uniref:Uncharacterized protein n=1 Tax=Hebeloma cylindrosporum TaxID=76867 RepID=A0A0C3CEX5_HEBCY|nr:hypothetical protein M413DRAFT_123192 [Hebeloma cylindrosporum h7]